MIKPIFRSEWRTQNRRKRWFYARYMGWLEKAGYVTVALIVGGFIFAFNYHVDDFITAEDVQIQADSQPIKFEEEVLIVKPLVENYEEVQQGQPVLEVVTGKVAIAAWRIKLAADRYEKETGKAVSGAGDQASLPTTTTVKASESGVFVLVGDVESTVAANEPIANLLFYDRLVVKPDLKGKTVAAAAADQPAQLSNIKFENPDQTLMRASVVTSSGSSTILSRQLLGDEIRSILNKGLQGQPVVVREDKPFKISEIQNVEVDATLGAGPGGQPTVHADPTVRETIQGIVRSGEHVIKVQVSDLPPALREQATAAMKKRLEGQVVGGSGFGDAKVDAVIRNVDSARFVVTASATPGGTPGQGLAASSVDRKYSAVVQLKDPPAELVRRLRLSDREGRKVTAKVEVKTGRRPIAYFLLRKS